MAKWSGELISDLLSDLLGQATELEGAAVIGADGLVHSAVLPRNALDNILVGTVTAASLAVSRKSVEQMQCGEFTQTLIQGDRGNIVISQLTPDVLLVGLSSANAKLDDVFAETRAIARRLRQAISILPRRLAA